MAVYGIDFGTCYSCLAVAEDTGEVHVVPAEDGLNTLPSVVLFNHRRNGKPVVGRTAKNALCDYGRNDVIAFAKSEMTKEYMDRTYRVDTNEERQVSTVEPVTCILHSMYRHAERHRMSQGLPPATGAVITVPAVCTDIQREKTRLAASLAGINVMRIINEPTAAAISYDIEEGETVLVFDLGGGTLDVSIIQRVSEHDYKVLSSKGNPKLGGRDWDRCLMQLSYELLGEEWTPAMATQHKLIEYERYKIDLCNAGDVEIRVEGAGGDEQAVDVQIEDFERATEHLTESALAIVDTAIGEAREENPELRISRVCMAGGASRMKAVQRALQRHLTDIPVMLSDPDLAIAKGAARYAQSLVTGETNYDIRLDERGHAYGILTTDNSMQPVVDNIIKRSDPLEIASRDFRRYMVTTSDRMWLKIIESEVSQAQYPYRGEPYYYDGEVRFDEAVPVGEAVDFTFSRDKDGLVTISAVCCGRRYPDIRFDTHCSTASPELIATIESLIAKME